MVFISRFGYIVLFRHYASLMKSKHFEDFSIPLAVLKFSHRIRNLIQVNLKIPLDWASFAKFAE